MVNIIWSHEPQAPEGSVLGLDTEFGAGGLRLVQFGYSDTAWLLVPGQDDEAILSTLGRYRFVTHSSADYESIMEHYGVDIRPVTRDTFLLSQLAHPDKLKHGLKELFAGTELAEAEKELHQHFKKLTGLTKQADYIPAGFSVCPVDDPLFARYAALDAVYVLKLWNSLSHKVPRQVFARETRIAHLAEAASRRGMLVDNERTDLLLAKAEEAIAKADARVKEITGLPARSPKLGLWLEERGIKIAERTDSGAPQLDKHNLPKLLERPDVVDDEDAWHVLQAKHVVSTNSNRRANLKAFKDRQDADGFIHPRVQTARARTGRWSYVAPAVQTLSAKGGDDSLRSCFIARPGHVLIGCDLDQVELRVAAALSGDRHMTAAIHRGEDLHNTTTDLIFGPGAHKDKDKRSVAKAANFLQVYGGGANKLSIQAKISPNLAQEVLSKFRSGYKELRQYLYDIQSEPIIRTYTGREMPADPDRPYASGNYAIQGSARDLLCDALLRFEKLQPGRFWLGVHDEVIAEAPIELAEAVRRDLESAMNSTFMNIPITGTAEILGGRWVKS